MNCSFFLINILLLLISIKSWKLKLWKSTFSFSLTKSSNQISKLILTSLLFLNTNIIHVNANDNDQSQQINALRKIQSVKDSIKYVQDDIATSGDPDVIVKELKALLSNYKLKDNVILASQLINNKDIREKVSTLGKEAYEDLVIVLEYFPDDLDNLSGRKKAPREVLSFAQEASTSSSKKLQQMLDLFPSDIVKSIKDESSISQSNL